MRLLVFAILLAFTLPGLAGCSSSTGPPAPTPTTAPATSAPPTSAPVTSTTSGATTPASRRAGVKALMDAFDQAVLDRTMTVARGYLAPSLRAQTPPMSLAALLGMQNIPMSAAYTIVSLGPRQAEVNVTYRLSHGAVRDRLTVVPVGARWLIAAIQHLS